MRLSNHQKLFPFHPSFTIIFALIFFLQFTACECDGIIEPTSSNNPQKITPPQPPANQLSITSLNYDAILILSRAPYKTKEMNP